MNFGAVAPIATAVVSLIVAILAHMRANKAQSEQNSLDRDKLINEAYQDVLGELRSEIERLNSSLAEERGRHEEEVRNFRAQINHLEEELQEERERRVRLEERVTHMQEELRGVEKRKGTHTTPTDEDGSDGGV